MKIKMEFFLVSLILLTGCSTIRSEKKELNPQDLILRDNVDLKDRAVLEINEIKEDVRLLVYALENAYGGRKYVDQAKYNHAIAELEKIKHNVGTKLSSVELRDLIDNILLKIPDGHLHIRSQQSGFSKAREDLERKPQVGRNIYLNKKIPWRLNYVFLKTKKIPVISITKFLDHKDEKWGGFKESVESIMNYSEIIIDFRGNGGGDDTMGHWLASRLLGDKRASPLESTILSNTSSTAAIALNTVKLKILGLKIRNEKVPQYLNDKLSEKEKRYYTLLQNKENNEKNVSETDLSIKNLGIPFKGKVYLLFDAECASSCESTIDDFENVKNVTTVGENTAGDIHFGNMGMIVLPHSQLITQMATDYWKYKNGRFLELIGHTPDIKVEKCGDAFSAALVLISPAYLKDDFYLVSNQESDEIKLLNNNRSKIQKKLKAIKKTWQDTSKNGVIVEVKDFNDNNEHYNCAWTAGSMHLLMHTRKSLEKLGKDKVNPYCKTIDDRGIINNVTHEYVHTRNLNYLKDGTPPLKWIWEGIAINLSGELQNRRTDLNIKKWLDENKDFNLCTTELSKEDSYRYGPYIIKNILDKKSELLFTLATIRSVEEFKKLSIGCLIKDFK